MKPGTLIRITYDGTTHEGQYGQLERPATKEETGYEHDWWINFSNGDRAPYGKHEFMIVTVDHLQDRIDELEALKMSAQLNELDEGLE